MKAMAEARFPYRVDAPLASTSMRQLTSMLAWCRAKLPAGTFELHHHSDDTSERGSIQYARFTFASDADASAFRRAWLDG
jgi:hypothetical protein